MTSDQQLWDQLKSGDKSALAAIYNREADYLYSYCCRLTPDKELILDCIQDLFVEIWNKRTSIGSTDNIRPYLITSIRRKVIHQLKKTIYTAGEIEEELAFRTEDDIETDIIAQENQSEKAKMLALGMEGLSKRQREAIYHKYYNNLSYDEICKVMELNYQSVRNLISSGIKRLRQNLNRE